MRQTELNESAVTANHVSSSYQKARINVFVNPSIRHQLDALSGEWDVPVTEALRRVLARGLQDIMHGDTE
jgi:hypothetical protein